MKRRLVAPKNAPQRARKPKKPAPDMVERLDRLGDRTVRGWAATTRLVFEDACEWEGWARETKIGVFSPGNPFVPFYEKAYQRYLEALAGVKAHGYVGLSMKCRNV